MSKLYTFSIEVEHLNDYGKVTICENKLPDFAEKTYEIGSKEHKNALVLKNLKLNHFKVLAENK